MVCDKCLEKQKKKGQAQGTITQDVWKEGAANVGKTDRVGAIDKRLTQKELHNPYSKQKPRECKICKDSILEGHYCKDCAYKKGICSGCGKKVVDTVTQYKSTNA